MTAYYRSADVPFEFVVVGYAKSNKSDGLAMERELLWQACRLEKGANGVLVVDEDAYTETQVSNGFGCIGAAYAGTPCYNPGIIVREKRRHLTKALVIKRVSRY
jgi:hypothetical protein